MLKKYKNASLPVKSAFWYLVCNAILKGIGFITVPVFALLLSDEENGILSGYMSFQIIMVSLCTWELYSGAYQRGLYSYKDEIRRFTTDTKLFLWMLSSLFFLLVLLLNRQVMSLTGYSFLSILMLYIYSLTVPSYHLWMTKCRNDYKYKQIVILSIFESVLLFAIPVFFVLFVDATAEVKFISSLAVEIIFSIAFVGKDFSIRLAFNKIRLKEIWTFLVRFQLPLLPHAFSFYILTQSDRVMVLKMSGDTSAAYYNVAYTLATSIAIFQAALNQTVLPWMYRKLENKEYHRIKKIAIDVLVLVMSVMMIFGLLAPDALRILFPKSYYSAALCIPPVVMSLFFSELYSLFVNVISYYKKTYYVSFASVLSGIINIVLNYFGIQLFGYRACAYTTYFCFLLMAFLCFFFLKKVCGDQGVDLTDLFNAKVLILLSVLSIALMLGMAALYSSVLLRYMSICVVAFIAVYIFKKVANQKELAAV